MSSPGKGEKTSEMETETNDSSLEVTSDTGEASPVLHWSPTGNTSFLGSLVNTWEVMQFWLL